MRGFARLAIAIFSLSGLAPIFVQEQTSKDPLEDLTGFTKIRHHVIFTDPKPIRVRRVQGQIMLRRSTYPMEDVIFEIRGPGNSKRVRRTRTDEDGRFRIRQVAPGRYVYKASLFGFQGLVGFIVVDRKAPKDSVIELRLSPEW